MSAPKLIEMCPSDKLSSCLYLQRQNGKFCDVELVFSDSKFPVHGCVVCSSSSYIERVLESLRSKVIVPKYDIPIPLNKTNYLWKDSQFCLECVEKVVDFMYFRRIQVDEDHVSHINALGDVLEIPELLKLCKAPMTVEEILVNSLQAVSSENTVLDLDLKAKNVLNCKADSENVCKITDRKDLSDLSKSSNQRSCPDSEWTVLDSDNLTCPKCKDSFANVFTLQQHCNTHLGKLYTCYICSYHTLKVPALLEHLKKSNHMETVCSLCLYETETNAILKEHLSGHDHPQPFFCRTCMARFQSRTALNSHIVSHSTETPFVCSVCGRGFKWKHGLQSHMNIHMSIKNHLCDQCGYSTAHLKSFQDHKITHSGIKFTCPISACQFASVRKESVKHHLLTHTKEKPYQCEVCGQAFSQAKNLKRHAVTHDSTANAIRCPCCSFRTMRSDKLKEHCKKNHKDSEDILPSKRNKTKRKNTAWPQEVKKDTKPPQKTSKESELCNDKEETEKPTIPVVSNDSVLLPVRMSIVSLSSPDLKSNEQSDCVFSIAPCNEVTLPHTAVDVTNLIFTTPEGEFVLVTDDQTNSSLHNSDDTLPLVTADIPRKNIQSVDSVFLADNASLEEISNGLVLKSEDTVKTDDTVKSEDTVTSDGEITFFSTESVLSLPGEANLRKYACDSDNNLCELTEEMVIEEADIDSMPIILLCPQDSLGTCVSLPYTSSDLQDPLQIKNTHLVSN